MIGVDVELGVVLVEVELIEQGVDAETPCIAEDGEEEGEDEEELEKARAWVKEVEKRVRKKFDGVEVPRMPVTRTGPPGERVVPPAKGATGNAGVAKGGEKGGDQPATVAAHCLSPPQRWIPPPPLPPINPFLFATEQRPNVRHQPRRPHRLWPVPTHDRVGLCHRELLHLHRNRRSELPLAKPAARS